MPISTASPYSIPLLTNGDMAQALTSVNSTSVYTNLHVHVCTHFPISQPVTALHPCVARKPEGWVWEASQFWPFRRRRFTNHSVCQAYLQHVNQPHAYTASPMHTLTVQPKVIPLTLALIRETNPSIKQHFWHGAHELQIRIKEVQKITLEYPGPWKT